MPHLLVLLPTCTSCFLHRICYRCLAFSKISQRPRVIKEALFSINTVSACKTKKYLEAEQSLRNVISKTNSSYEIMEKLKCLTKYSKTTKGNNNVCDKDYSHKLNSFRLFPWADEALTLLPSLIKFSKIPKTEETEAMSRCIAVRSTKNTSTIRTLLNAFYLLPWRKEVIQSLKEIISTC